MPEMSGYNRELAEYGTTVSRMERFADAASSNASNEFRFSRIRRFEKDGDTGTRSDLVFGAIGQASGRYLLCRVAAAAARKLHKRNERIQDTINNVLIRLSKSSPVFKAAALPEARHPVVPRSTRSFHSPAILDLNLISVAAGHLETKAAERPRRLACGGAPCLAG
jgi:hypothetical protein